MIRRKGPLFYALLIYLVTNLQHGPYQRCSGLQTAPRYHQGYVFVAGHSAALMVWSYVTLFFYKRQERKDARSNGIVLYNSKTGDISVEARKHLETESAPGDVFEADSNSLTKTQERLEVRSISE